MGRDVLIQDYFLKQLSATLMDPDNEIGQEYWDRLYAHVYEKYGVVELPSSTFNKIWIVPERAQIYEHKQGALLVESHLKVMMEEDYLSIRKDQIVNRTDESSDQIPRDIQELSSDIIKEVMLPVIEKEVNTGETFKKPPADLLSDGFGRVVQEQSEKEHCQLPLCGSKEDHWLASR